MRSRMTRRAFGQSLLAAAASPVLIPPAAQAAPYRGPNIILVRYGGGVRRREIIDPAHTLSPFFRNVLVPQGVLFPDMRIQSAEGIVTSHAQGTLYLLTGRYDRYQDVKKQFLRERFEPKAPTLFEIVRAATGIAEHEALIVNGENRKDEDFFTYSSDPHYGVQFRSSVVSLNQFKARILRERITKGDFEGNDLIKAQKRLADLEAEDMRRGKVPSSAPIDAFWSKWRADYGDDGFKNPRGDRLLTELALRALRGLQPKLMLINYQDPDYVHFGNASHYSRAIGIIDQALQMLVTAVETLPGYRNNTVFAIVPDCGRDDNRFVPVPYQHHFGSPEAHKIFALFFGPGIAKGQVVDKPVEQIAVMPTLARLMGVQAPSADAPLLQEVFA